jgi:hypothetical protein
MKRRVVLAAVSLAAFGACSADAGPRADAETYIRESEAAWVQAEVTGDPSVARRILAEDYVGVFPDGSVANKSVAVSFFTPRNAMTSGRLDYVHVRVFGDAAIAQGQETDSRPRASPLPSGRLIFTDVWLLRSGEWRIANSEDQFQPLKQPMGH